MRNLAPFMLHPLEYQQKKNPLDTLLLHVEIRKESCNFESTNIPHLTHLVANEIQLSTSPPVPGSLQKPFLIRNNKSKS